MPTAEEFENEISKRLKQAESRGANSVDIVSRDVHRAVGDYPGPDHRMPMCVSAMRRMMRGGDLIIEEPPSGQGASVTVRYKLPR